MGTKRSLFLLILIISVAFVSLNTVSAAGSATHMVQRGDTLNKLAAAYGTSVSSIMRANNLNSYTIYVGQALQIPTGGYTTHVVKRGDTLNKLAARYGSTVRGIMNANGLSSYMIYIGQTLRIPTGTRPVSSSLNPAAPPVRHVLMNREFHFPFPQGTDYYYRNDFGAPRSWSPNGTVRRSHEGVDIFAAEGTPLVAVADGTITKIGWNRYGGWMILYKVDGTDRYFYYAHLSKYAPGLTKGARVERGQLLGYVGKTGYGPVGSTFRCRPHLHFGIYRGYRAENPYYFLRYWENNKVGI